MKTVKNNQDYFSYPKLFIFILLFILISTLLCNYNPYERQFFGIIKYIPIVGQLYGYVRAISYKVQGNDVEAKRSISFDFSDFMPTRVLCNLARGVKNANYDYNEGIWIGTRPLFF